MAEIGGKLPQCACVELSVADGGANDVSVTVCAADDLMMDGCKAELQ
jgi:hypothetical protein